MEDDKTNTNPEDFEFYEKAEKYWSNIEPTLDGVLGGFGFISPADINGSKQFLLKLMREEKGPDGGRALDCGAGVGRVTKELLVNHFQTVDLVEQNKKFLEEAKKSLSGYANVGNFYQFSLKDFVPDQCYDVIWCQWVLGHLTDDHLINFLKRCAKALQPNGLIIVKENVSNGSEVLMDENDSSITRPSTHFVKLFRKSSLHVTRQAHQKNFPKQLFSVKLYALKPDHYVGSAV